MTAALAPVEAMVVVVVALAYTGVHIAVAVVGADAVPADGVETETAIATVADAVGVAQPVGILASAEAHTQIDLVLDRMSKRFVVLVIVAVTA